MIAKALANILLANETVAAIVNGNIYPIIDIPEESNEKLSAIYYSVVMSTEYTKNGPAANNHIVKFLTIADTYLGSWELALAVRDALLGMKATVKDVEFTLSRFPEIADEYEFTPINMYGQQLTWNIRTTYY